MMNSKIANNLQMLPFGLNQIWFIEIEVKMLCDDANERQIGATKMACLN